MDPNKRFEKLFDPGYIGKVKTRNRIIKTANGTSFIEPTGYVGERAKAYYEDMAKGGVGLLIVESCGVEYPRGVQHATSQFHLDDDKYIPSYRELVDVVHKHGCPVFIQFIHAGPYNPTGLLEKRDTVAASALTREELPGPEFAPTRALTLEEVKNNIDIWAKAAERAAKAGFDGVEINGSTSHLINTFFSRVWNKREDEYGCATLENRARFMCDIVAEVKKRVGNYLAVTCLFNIAENGHEKGTTVQEGMQFARLIEAAGADAIQFRAYGYNPAVNPLATNRNFYPEQLGPLPEYMDWSRQGKGAFVPLSEALKKVVSVPVFCACRLDPVIGEEYLRQGKLDFVGMTRRLLADPELPNKVAAGRLEDITPCTGCYLCIDVRNKNLPVICRVNARLGRETELLMKPAENKKKVIVIGGGPAGMEAARVAAQRGHQVTLCDKDTKLGGLVPLAAMFKDLEMDDLLDLVKCLENRMVKAGVTIRRGKEVSPSFISDMKPDVIILAAGGAPGNIAIPGANLKKVANTAKMHGLLKTMKRYLGVKTLERLTRIWMPIGKRVVVIGGTIHGCELAEFLIKRGRNVTIVHEGDNLGEGMTREDIFRFTKWLNVKGAKAVTGIQYEEIDNNGLVIKDKDGKRQMLAADTVVIALPLQANTRLAVSLKGAAPEFYVIGDCKEARLMVDAIADGAIIGNMI